MRRYSAVAIAFHWLTAAAIVMQLMLAVRMATAAGQHRFDLIQLHKSVGFTILALAVARLAWRLLHRPPPYPAAMAVWERRLATAAHWSFYGLLIGLPLTGWITVSASSLSIPTVLYTRVPIPHLPVSEALFKPAAMTHVALAFCLIGLLLLHVAGAAKHQMARADARVLPRMAPGLTLWFIAILVAVVAAFGLTMTPPYAPSPGRVIKWDKPTMAAPALAGSNWTLDPESRLLFETSWAGAPVRGRFMRWNAAIAFDDAHINKAQMMVVVDLASANTGDAQRDGALASPDWFNTVLQPVATFEADRFEKLEWPNYVAHGRLTIAGQSRPVDVPFTMSPDGPERVVQGKVRLNRHDFNIGRGQPDSQVPAEVTVQFDVIARNPAIPEPDVEFLR